jgi:hypothetical protein
MHRALCFISSKAKAQKKKKKQKKKIPIETTP